MEKNQRPRGKGVRDEAGVAGGGHFQIHYVKDWG